MQPDVPGFVCAPYTPTKVFPQTPYLFLSTNADAVHNSSSTWMLKLSVRAATVSSLLFCRSFTKLRSSNVAQRYKDGTKRGDVEVTSGTTGLDLLNLSPGFATTLPVTVVDCGSGSTRAISFTDDGVLPLSWEKSSWRGDALVSALKHELHTKALICLIAKNIPTGPVLLGATAGIRQALADGELTSAQLQGFQRRCQDRMGARARFAVLSGLDESKAEWTALLYKLKSHSFKANECMGMLSGGGMSCQLAIRNTGTSDAFDASFFTVQNGVLAPGGLVDRASHGELTTTELRRGLEAVEASAAEQLRGLPQGLSGSYALVEWVGLYVGGHDTERDIGLGLSYERAIGRNELLEALELKLSSLQKSIEMDCKIPRKVVVALVYGTVLKALFSNTFAPNSVFQCLDGVHWATGHYLLDKARWF